MTVHRPKPGWKKTGSENGTEGRRTRSNPSTPALCYRRKGKKSEFLLITSRDTGRWIIPKGWAIKNLSEAETAEREAFEEAGVVGRIQSKPLGTFDYEKWLGGGISISCRVQVFALEVDHLEKSYPEAHQRQRKWFGKKGASSRIQEKELRDLIANFAA